MKNMYGKTSCLLEEGRKMGLCVLTQPLMFQLHQMGGYIHASHQKIQFAYAFV